MLIKNQLDHWQQSPMSSYMLNVMQAGCCLLLEAVFSVTSTISGVGILTIIALVVLPSMAFSLEKPVCDQEAMTRSDREITKEDLRTEFQKGRWVKNRVISGEHLAEIIAEGTVEIRVRDSVIKDGLDLSGRNPTRAISIRNTHIMPSKLTRRPRAGHAIYARGTQFQKAIDLTGSFIAGPADFSEAKFTSVSATKACFEGKADFSSASFSMVTLFLGAKFSSEALFSAVSFADRAHFSHTTFEQGANFSDAVFNALVTFRDVGFESGSTHFQAAIFKQIAVFNEALFKGPVDFSKHDSITGEFIRPAVFEKGASFVHAELLNNIVDPENWTGC